MISILEKLLQARWSAFLPWLSSIFGSIRVEKKSNTLLEHLGFHPVEGGGGTGGSEASPPPRI